MIIAQYGKMIIWCLRKWVLHNLSIGSTLPNTKNFFLAMFCWIVMRNYGEKEWAAHRAALVSAKTTYIHTVKQLTLWAVSVLCMYSWNLADFEPKHRHPPLMRLHSWCKDTTFSWKNAWNEKKLEEKNSGPPTMWILPSANVYKHTVKQPTLWAVSVLCLLCWILPIQDSKHRFQPLTRLLSCCKDTIFSRMDNHLSKKKSYLQTKNVFLSLLEAQNEQCNALLPYHGDEHYD